MGTVKSDCAVLEVNCDVMSEMLIEKNDQIDALRGCLQCIVTEATWGPDPVGEYMNMLIQRAEDLLKRRG